MFASLSVTQNLESALDKFVSTGKLSFSDLARSIISDLIKIQLKAQATSIFKGLDIGGLFGSIFGGGGGYTPGYSSLASAPFPKFADGGSISGPSIVGERGPELFVPRGSGTIIPNNQLGSAMGGQPQVVYNGPYIANLQAIDTQSATQFLAKNKQAVWSANQSAQRSLPQSR
jgi:phage-related minor tail protein